MSPVVTIGLPFYNNRSTLELAIKSVIAQTYSNWNLILLDDGSTDGSREIAKNYVDDIKITLISDGINKGLICRLNQLAHLATGKYLARMDADDLMDPERIKKQVEYLELHQEVDLVDTGTYSINEDGSPVGKRGLQEINTDPKYVLTHAMLLHASVVGKRDWFVNNPYDEDYVRAEDYELWCRTYKYSKFARIKEPLYIVREGNINIKNYIRSSKTIAKVILRYGTGVLSPAELQIAVATLSVKRALYKVFAVFNKHHYLVRSRNLALSSDEKKQVEETIAKISQVGVSNSSIK